MWEKSIKVYNTKKDKDFERGIMKPIGIIHTPFKDIASMPIQPKGAKDIIGEIHINEEYIQGLKDLEGFSHIYLIYHLHKVQKTNLMVVPFMDSVERGVFSTRSPQRPNHIGLSITRIEKIENGIITIKGIDVLDGTPLLDIKPYIKNFDAVEEVNSSGWMKANNEEVENKRSDNRFK
jgi:tRNA (adenine37-N6)-methyltransferase